VSQHHLDGVYDGEAGKVADYNASLPTYLMGQVLRPHLEAGGRAVVIAEEWQTVDSVLQLHWLMRYAGLRDRVSMLWNANNTFGFEQIPWEQLAAASTITTVSRYMKHRMRQFGADALVIPNGLTADCFDAPERNPVAELRRRFRGRTFLTKMARWDPDKRWLETVDTVAEMKRQGWHPLLVARGGSEEHGREVLQRVRDAGLQMVDRTATRPGAAGLAEALRDTNGADVVNLHSYVDPDARRALFRSVDAVLANSGHEPFGLVGLEAMAVGGIACTGCSGEDYAQPGQNAIVLETGDPREFISLFRSLRADPERAKRLRRAGQATAKRYAWGEIVDQVLLPRAEMHHPSEVSPPSMASLLPARSRRRMRKAG
jgi:glycosyltransferase involved in cell wall biosynthesis